MGAGINEAFADNPQENIFGLMTGSATRVVFPSGSAKLLRFKASPQNTGNVLLGAANQATCTWPLAPGDDTGWIAPPSYDGNLGGLNSYAYQSPSGTAERVYYWIQR
jgi:hypothetical protein